MKKFVIGKDGFSLPSTLVTSTQAIIEVYPLCDPAKIAQKIVNATKENTNSPSCWEWSGYTKNGYGAMSICNHLEYVHRLSFLLFVGEIGPRMFVCHSCDNRVCWRPDHLFEGTSQDNHADMWSKGRGKHHPWAKGIANCNATLTNEQIKEILSRCNETQRSLAKAYDVSQSTIWRLRNGSVRQDATRTRESGIVYANSLLFPESN